MRKHDGELETGGKKHFCAVALGQTLITHRRVHLVPPPPRLFITNTSAGGQRASRRAASQEPASGPGRPWAGKTPSAPVWKDKLLLRRHRPPPAGTNGLNESDMTAINDPGESRFIPIKQESL